MSSTRHHTVALPSHSKVAAPVTGKSPVVIKATTARVEVGFREAPFTQGMMRVALREMRRAGAPDHAKVAVYPNPDPATRARFDASSYYRNYTADDGLTEAQLLYRVRANLMTKEVTPPLVVVRAQWEVA